MGGSSPIRIVDRALLRVSATMTDTEVVTLKDGRVFSKRDCCVEALHLQPGSIDAYGHLKEWMSSITLKDGRQLARRDCSVLDALERRLGSE